MCFTLEVKECHIISANEHMFTNFLNFLVKSAFNLSVSVLVESLHNVPTPWNSSALE